MARTAFVTGGTGFVGGHLCERLRAEGWDVTALVRDPRRADVLKTCGCKLVQGDLLDERLDELFHPCDYEALFHLAGVTKALNARQFAEVNGHGTRKLCDWLHAWPNPHVVHLSSLAAAGPAVRGRPRLEADTSAPVSLYGRSKLMGERQVRLSAWGGRWTVLRPGAIYGPREHEIFEILKPLDRFGVAVAAGRDIRLQMTHVDDVVEAMIRVVDCEAAADKTLNVVEPTVWKYSELIQEMGRALGRRVRTIRVPMAAARVAARAIDAASRRAGRPLAPFNGDKLREMEAGDWIASPARLMKATGWKPKWELRPGLEQTVRWYRDNGWL